MQITRSSRLGKLPIKEVINLQEFDPEKEQENQINRENAGHVFSPKFIPFYPELLKLKLTVSDILIYGFIDFYTSTNSERFYFTNEQLAKIVGCSIPTITRGIKRLNDLKLLKVHYKIKANGGQIRFVENVHSSKSMFPPNQNDLTTSSKRLGNNNKINNNKINNNMFPKGNSSKNAATSPKIVDNSNVKTAITNTNRQNNLGLIVYLKEKLQTDLEGSSETNWHYCTHLLNRLRKLSPNKNAVQSVKVLIDIALSDPFHAGNLTNFKYLFNNYLKIINGYKQRKNTIAVI